jgi:hypothetical protein
MRRPRARAGGTGHNQVAIGGLPAKNAPSRLQQASFQRFPFDEMTGAWVKNNRHELQR